MLRTGWVYLLILCGMIGCISNRITRCYDFTAPVKVIEHKDLTVSAGLMGAISSGEKTGRHNVSVRSNPYELLIQVSAISLYYKSATITNLRMMDQRGVQIDIPEMLTPQTSVFTQVPTGYAAKLSFKGLDLSYESHRLFLEIDIHTKANSRERLNVEFVLSPLYTEEKSNDTWSKYKNK